MAYVMVLQSKYTRNPTVIYFAINTIKLDDNTRVFYDDYLLTTMLFLVSYRRCRLQVYMQYKLQAMRHILQNITFTE